MNDPTIIILVVRDRSMNAVITKIKVLIIGRLKFLKSFEFFMKKKKKTLWPLFMDRVLLPQG